MYLCSKLSADLHAPKKERKPNVSVGCSHGASLSPDTGVSLQWGGGSHSAAYPIPHPPKQIKCLIQTRPLSAPQPQPLSRPLGTMPTVIRRLHRWSNTDTQAQLLHSLLMDSQSGFNCGIVCDGQLIQIIWVLGNIQTHRHICNAEDKVRVYRNKKVSHGCALLPQRSEHTRSQLKATEREYHARTFPLEHGAKWGIKRPFWSS